MKTETKKAISNFTEEISDSQDFLDAVQEFESTIAGLAIDYFRRHNITENGDIDLLLRGVRNLSLPDEHTIKERYYNTDWH